MHPRYVMFAHRMRGNPDRIEVTLRKGWWSKQTHQVASREVASFSIEVGPADEGVALSLALRELADVLDAQRP